MKNDTVYLIILLLVKLLGELLGLLISNKLFKPVKNSQGRPLVPLAKPLTIFSKSVVKKNNKGRRKNFVFSLVIKSERREHLVN